MKAASRAAWPALTLLLLALGSAAASLAQSATAKDSAKDKKAGDATTLLLIHVVGGQKPAPVVNANVYLHFQEKDALLFLLRKHKKIELDLKTDNNGYASFPVLPQGKLLIQVVADGWEPFGEYFSLNQSRQNIQIKLRRPKTHWY